VIAYRLGEGSAETMLQLWQQEMELQGEVEQARATCHQQRAQLQGIVFPGPPTIIPSTSESQK
jgi:hypothetical protein